jgi:hypothetical protein
MQVTALTDHFLSTLQFHQFMSTKVPNAWFSQVYFEQYE